MNCLMKFHLINRGRMVMIKKSLFLISLSILICASSVESAFSQKIPDRPSPPRLVNDFTGLLKAR